MIKNITINNFQSHKGSDIELSKGINSIIGSSDQGKSAVLRALLWAVTNRPLGDSFVSYWGGDTKVEINIEDSIVTREKGAENKYTFRGKDFKAIGTDVPEDIVDFFNLSDVNIQKQLDPHFLLSQSSGEVAKFLNKIIKLDDIDEALRIVEQKKRKTRSRVKTCEENIKSLEGEIKNLSWLDDARKFITKLKRISERVNFNKDRKSKIILHLDNYHLNLDITKREEVVFAEKLLKEYDEEIGESEKFKTDFNLLSENVDTYRNFDEDISIWEEAKKVVNLLSCWGKTVSESTVIRDKVDKLTELVDNFDDSKFEKQKRIDKIEELEDQLPNVCPLCGNKKEE